MKAGDIVRVQPKDNDDPEAVRNAGYRFKVLKIRIAPDTGTILVRVGTLQDNRALHTYRACDLVVDNG